MYSFWHYQLFNSLSVKFVTFFFCVVIIDYFLYLLSMQTLCTNIKLSQLAYQSEFVLLLCFCAIESFNQLASLTATLQLCLFFSHEWNVRTRMYSLRPSKTNLESDVTHPNIINRYYVDFLWDEGSTLLLATKCYIFLKKLTTYIFLKVIILNLFFNFIIVNLSVCTSRIIHLLSIPFRSKEDTQLK